MDALDQLASETGYADPVTGEMQESGPASANSAIRALLKVRNLLWAGLGFLCLALGIIGAFLPVLPTTVFLIVATWAFAEACPAWKEWIWNHPRFGASVRLWFEHGVIPLRTKRIALSTIVFSYALTAWLTSNLTAVLVVGAILLAVCLFIVTRPEGS